MLSDVWYFTFLQSLFFLRWNYMYWTFVDLSIFTAVDKVKDGILYNKVWKDNWTYWDTCQYWVHFKRNYNLFDQLMLLLLYCFLFMSLDTPVIFESIVITSYYKLDPSLPIFDHMKFIIWWIYWLKIKHIYIFII